MPPFVTRDGADVTPVVSAVAPRFADGSVVTAIGTLAIAPRAEARWRRLAPEVQAYLRAYLGGGGMTPAHPVGSAAPPWLADDLAHGAPELRAAFPALARTVTAIHGNAHLVVDIVCEGEHAGAFFGFVRPTNRHVVFDEVHHLAFDATGRITGDDLALDVRAIIRQLSVPR